MLRIAPTLGATLRRSLFRNIVRYYSKQWIARGFCDSQGLPL